jgi:hypothetical protein
MAAETSILISRQQIELIKEPMIRAAPDPDEVGGIEATGFAAPVVLAQTSTSIQNAALFADMLSPPERWKISHARSDVATAQTAKSGQLSSRNLRRSHVMPENPQSFSTVHNFE